MGDRDSGLDIVPTSLSIRQAFVFASEHVNFESVALNAAGSRLDVPKIAIPASVDPGRALGLGDSNQLRDVFAKASISRSAVSFCESVTYIPAAACASDAAGEVLRSTGLAQGHVEPELMPEPMPEQELEPDSDADMELLGRHVSDTPVLPPTILRSERRRRMHGVRSRVTFAPSAIVGLEIGLLGEDELRRMAFAITETEKLSENGIPKIGGVNDPRQGVTQNRFLCPTCGCDALECNGHLGMIVLPWPVFQVGQFLNDLCTELTLVCWACCRRRFDDADSRVKAIDARHPPGLPSRDRVAALAGVAKCARFCAHCDAPQPAYKIVKAMHAIAWNWLVKKAAPKRFVDSVASFGADMFDETNRPFTAARAYDILSGVSRDDWLFCGVNADVSHPKNKILRVLPVPPNCLRPTFSSTEGSSMHGMPDITTLLHTHVAKTVSSIWKAVARGRVDDRSAYLGGVAADHVPEDIWRKRSWQDLLASQVVRKARAALCVVPCASGGAGPAADASESVYARAGAEEQPTREVDRRKTALPIVLRLGGNWSGQTTARDATSATWLVDPCEEHRVASLVEFSRPDVLCKSARTYSSCGIEGAEWAVAALSSEYEKLQLAVAALYLNDDRGAVYKDAKQRNGAPLRGIYLTLQKKTGMVKSALMATRSFFSARSVATAAAGELDIDEIGVPASFAKMLTFPDRVTGCNAAQLLRCVHAGPHVLGGATTVIRAGCGDRIYLTHVAQAADRRRLSLRVGDVVERHLRDGDFIIVNRQPTLHRPSILAGRARIHGDETIKLHLAQTSPMNADFDGDEVNIHVPQTIEALAEIKELMAVQKQIILPKNNAPCIGPVQDTIVAAYRLSRREVFLTRAEMMQLASQLRYPTRHDSRPTRLPPPAILLPRALWTGKQAISLVFPACLQLERSVEGGDVADVMDADERVVCIQKGELLCGVLTKDVFGISPGGITHRVAMDAGPEAAKSYLSDVFRLLHEWFQSKGFSIGIDDMTVPVAVHRDIVRTMHSAELAITRAERLRDSAHKRLGEFDQARLETAAFSLMSSALDRASDVERAHRANLPWAPERALDDMIRAKSKGKNENRESLKVALGVTIVGASRISRNAAGRTLPPFASFDPSPAAQGFVCGNYVDGLNPAEYYFHAMGGRRGLADTAVKTAETGYMQKRIVKCTEDIAARIDGSLRRSRNRVVQSCYGGDGMDPTLTESVPMPAFAIPQAQMLGAAQGSHAYQAELLRLRAQARVMRLSPLFDSVEHSAQLPIHPWNAWCGIGTGVGTGESVFERLIFSGCAPEAGDGSSSLLHFAAWMRARHGPKCTTMAFVALWELRPSRLRASRTKRGQLGWGRLRCALAAVASKYERALVPEGDAAGIVAAQSIGEPSTQMTLNTFHMSGKGNSRMSMGVPRMHEIIDRRKSSGMLSPSMTLPTTRNTRAAAEALARRLKRVALAEVVHLDCFVALDPVADAHAEEPTIIPADRELLRSVARVCGSERAVDPQGTHFSPYVIRIQLNRDRLMDLGIASPVSTMVKAVSAACVLPVCIVHSDEGADVWVIRVRIHDDDASPQSSLKTRSASVQLYAHIMARACTSGTSQRLSDPWPCEVPHVSLDADTGLLERRNRWAVSLKGSCMPAIAHTDGVDWEHSTTNDLNEVASEFGICAVEDAIAAELYRVLTFDGSYIDKRHVSLVASAMTHTGRWLALTRHGLSAMGTSVLHQASFEQTSKELQEGAAQGYVDTLDTPAGAMCMSVVAPVGTGRVAVKKDYRLPRNTPVVTDRMMMELQNGMIRQAAIKPRKLDRGIMVDARTGMELRRSLSAASVDDELRITRGPTHAYTIQSSTGNREMYVSATADLAAMQRAVPLESGAAADQLRQQLTSRAADTSRKRARQGHTQMKGMQDVVKSKTHLLVSVDDPFGVGQELAGIHQSTSAPNPLAATTGPAPAKVLGIVASFVSAFGKMHEVSL